MNNLHFETITNIRRDAGLHRAVEAMTGGSRANIVGNIDGVNKRFIIPDVPIVDMNNDDIVDINDMRAWVNGEEVEVEEVDEHKGVVTLVNAPKSNSELIIRYVTSQAPDDYIRDMREKVERWLVDCIKHVYDIDAVTARGVFPNEWANIVRLRTAGYIQIQDWGTNTDTDGTSKDGYKKLEMSKQLLDDWLEAIKKSDDNNVLLNAQVSVMVSDSNVFGRNSFRPRSNSSRSDECFHNCGRC